MGVNLEHRKNFVDILILRARKRKTKLGVVPLRSCHKNLAREGALFLRAVFSHASPGHSLNPVNSIYISDFLSPICLLVLLIYSAIFFALVLCFPSVFIILVCLWKQLYYCWNLSLRFWLYVYAG